MFALVTCVRFGYDIPLQFDKIPTLDTDAMRGNHGGAVEPAGDTHCYETSVIVGVQFRDVRSWAPAYKAHDLERVGVAIAPRADHSHCQRPFFRLFDFKRLARCWARLRSVQQYEHRADRPHSTGRPHSAQL
jgi:hypothetical protein